jgi:hypothetical protein
VTQKKNSSRKASKPAKPLIRFIDPPKDGKFATSVLCKAREELIDSVISTGSLGIHPRLLELDPSVTALSDAQLVAALRQEAKDLIKYHTYGEETGEDLIFDTSLEPYSQPCVKAAAKIISVEVNAFTDTDEEETNRISGDLAKILKGLPVNASTTKVASARAVYNDEDEDNKRHVTVTIFANLRTNRAVVFYMVEGRM